MSLNHTSSGGLSSTTLQFGDNTGAACCALSQSQDFVPKKLLEGFVLISSKQLRQRKLHNPFAA